MKTKGLIHLYIGRGKGKTTAAVGLALRAAGAGKKVCFIQFLKPRPSSEVSMLKRIGVKVISFKEKHPLFYKSASIEALKKKVSDDLKMAKAILKTRKYDLIVLDEVLYLLAEKLAKECDIIRIIRSKPPRAELVLTGSMATRRIMALADYVSTINATKHPFKKGVIARRGIEY